MTRSQQITELQRVIKTYQPIVDDYELAKKLLLFLETTFEVGEGIEVYDYPFYSPDEKLQIRGIIEKVDNGYYDVRDEVNKLWTRVSAQYIRRP